MLIYSRQADPETSGQPPCTSDHSNVGKLGAQSEARFVPPEHIAAEIQALNDKFEAEKTLFERKWVSSANSITAEVSFTSLSLALCLQKSSTESLV